MVKVRVQIMHISSVILVVIIKVTVRVGLRFRICVKVRACNSIIFVCISVVLDLWL